MPSDSPYPVKKGETYDLQIERLAFGARGVAKVDGYTVFVDRGLPGQHVEARIYRRRKSYAEARIQRILEPSPQEVAPLCRDFGTCGGCVLQHYAYPAQLQAKRNQVQECLERIGGLTVAVRPVIPAPKPFEYRGKMEYSFGDRCWLTEDAIQSEENQDRFALGLHIPGRHDRILNIDRCHLQSKTGSAILHEVRGAARQSGLPSYTTKTHQGFWRFLVIRETTLGERMVNLITNSLGSSHPGHAVLETLAERLARQFDITSLLHSQTGSKANVAKSETVRVLHGREVIRERVMGCEFEIGPNTFFQSNPWQADTLFKQAVGEGAWLRGAVVWDLYCGVGALTLPLAQHADQVVGFELVDESVRAARKNAIRNGIRNVRFQAGDIKDHLAAKASGFPEPEVVVVDPPRDGLHPKVALALCQKAPKALVYISCNPATLARDLQTLVAGGYDLDSIQPVDMFPHTAHIECVAHLRRARG